MSEPDPRSPVAAVCEAVAMRLSVAGMDATRLHGSQRQQNAVPVRLSPNWKTQEHEAVPRKVKASASSTARPRLNPKVTVTLSESSIALLDSIAASISNRQKSEPADSTDRVRKRGKFGRSTVIEMIVEGIAAAQHKLDLSEAIDARDGADMIARAIIRRK